MRDKGYGVIGTCTFRLRILADFCDKKAKDAKKDEILWGTLFHEPSEDGKIQFVAWKDNALVLFITTIEGEFKLVERQRKRPSKTSNSVKTVRQPFGDDPTAILKILVLDNKYNH